MTPNDAICDIVKHYPGGLDALAVELDKPRETLRKELGDDPKFKLGLTTACRISALAIEKKSKSCYAFVNSVSAEAGGFVPLPVIDMGSDRCLQRSMSDVIREMSDVATVTIEGDSDGVISDNDLERSMREISEARAALQLHEQRLRSKHAAGKPAFLRGVA